MQNTHPRKNCINCNRLFKVNPKTAFHQKYCSRQPCKKASKVASQQRWRSQPVNRERWSGPIEVQRVREWREKHKGYWRGHRRKSRVRYKR